MKELNKHYAANQDFQWLYNFWNNEYKVFNEDRIKIVHTISQNVDDAWNYLEDKGFIDRAVAEEYSEKLLSYTEYFKKMNNLCKEGLVKTLSFLEYVNNDEGYKCPEL